MVEIALAIGVHLVLIGAVVWIARGGSFTDTFTVTCPSCRAVLGKSDFACAQCGTGNLRLVKVKGESFLWCPGCRGYTTMYCPVNGCETTIKEPVRDAA